MAIRADYRRRVLVSLSWSDAPLAAHVTPTGIGQRNNANTARIGRPMPVGLTP